MEKFAPGSNNNSNTTNNKSDPTVAAATATSPEKNTATISSSLALSPSYDTADTTVVEEQSIELEWKERPICMEEFKADEIVSWSPDDQTSCLHFFHHECIKGTWVVENTNVVKWMVPVVC